VKFMAQTTKSDLTFTGERFVPGEGGARIAYEHYHRYFFAQSLARGKVVLDLGCGEGYGSNLLAEVAERVTGIDLSAESIEHARGRYTRANLNFMAADCRKTGLPGEPFDLIVCFEMIEHIAEHEELLREVQRLLQPGGVFVASSPNKEFYSDREGFENPFHLKELYLRDFDALLRKHFSHVILFAQSLCLGSVLWRIASPAKDAQYRPELIEVEAQREKSSLHLERVEGHTKYAVAVCSAAKLGPEVESLGLSCLNDSTETVTKELEHYNRELLGMIDTMHGHLRNVGNLLIDKDNRIAQRDLAIQEKQNHIAVLHQVIEGKDRIITDKDQAILARDQVIQAKEVRIMGLEQGMQILRDFEIKVKSTLMWRAYRTFVRPLRLLFRRGPAS
jgi:ubiquinone/menaquinone biosynthesis C-methylase UbiE